MRLKIFFLLLIVIIFSTACKQNKNILSVVSSPDLSDHPLYSNYNFGEDESIIDIGIQPLSIPPGIIGALFGHDGILRESLLVMGYEIRIHPFYKSADSNFFLERGDLELATGGDMPAILAAVNMDVVITSLVKYGYSSIISDEFMLISEFKNKRIGYPHISNAHFSLLEVLKSSGMNEKDTKLIPMNFMDMAGALNRGDIDIFTTWEPNSSLVLKENSNFMVLHKSLNTSYLYFSKTFFDRHLEAVNYILASQIRSMKWLDKSENNRFLAAKLTAPYRLDLNTDSMFISSQLINKIILGDLLSVSSLGVLPAGELNLSGRIYKEFLFLKELGRLPIESEWEKVKKSFDRTILENILDQRIKYKINEYMYPDIL